MHDLSTSKNVEIPAKKSYTLSYQHYPHFLCTKQVFINSKKETNVLWRNDKWRFLGIKSGKAAYLYTYKKERKCQNL